MILQKITLQNFGVFRDTHEFNLKPLLIENKPIILFGGLNGSGKTTLFEGIKLCLYGRSNYKEFKTKKAYHSYIAKKIQPLSPKKRKQYYGSIEIEIEFNDFGVKDIYSVRRSWTVEDENVEENFRVLKNEELIGQIEQEYSQSFIANLIPMGISNLFFFDGEKIQELAQDTLDNNYFKEALDSILGLDVIQTLENDLSILSYKTLSGNENDEIESKIELIKQEILDYENLLAVKHQEMASIRTKLEKTQDIIQNKENALAIQGSGYAERRSEFKEKANQAETQQTEIRRRLRELYSELFPFALVPKLSSQLKDRIQDESKRKIQLSTVQVLNEKKKDFATSLMSKNGYIEKITNNQESLIDDIFKTFQELLDKSNGADFHFITDFSEKELDQLLYWVDQTANKIPNEIKKLAKQYEEKRSKRSYYENMLRKVPDDSILNPIVIEINKQYSALGGYKNQLRLIEEEINQLNWRHTESNRSLENVLIEYEEQKKHERKVKLLKKIRNMLDEYQGFIREDKMEMLRVSFLDAITMIIRKHDFINDIQIDTNYNIQLQRADGHYIHKDMLSNGEKQIYAISMLLALARVSGRPLPFIIDTPLARLDSTHRANIVDNFFPNASHQVIIFSTDTEIDKKYFERLTPYITRVYHLEWDNRESTSNATEGYFWKTLEVTQD